MERKPKIGLLPLYLELYDRVIPQLRTKVEEFVRSIKQEFLSRGNDVIIADICRVSKEFKQAITIFEKEDVDAIVTLHLAYSPSLESAYWLAKTRLPILILDTTLFYTLEVSKDSDWIMLNHGIHGVQDLCSILNRLGKKFIIRAGHWEESGVIDQISKDVRSASIRRLIMKSKIGSIGGSFKGMGDFQVAPRNLKKEIGIQTIYTTPESLVNVVPPTYSKEVKSEVEYLLSRYKIELGSPNFDKSNLQDSLIKSVRAGIAVRKWIESNKLTGFTMNFTRISRTSGLPTVPFVEAGLAMARGLGYAGEGDVLTSALVGVLASIYKYVTFTEMFCPDWKNEVIFLSHMGEVNIDLLEEAGIVVKDLPFIDISPPAILCGRLIEGQAMLVNLAPQKESYVLTICLGKIINTNEPDWLKHTIRGWFKPDRSISDLLVLFSKAGGTHHSALVYGGSDIAKEILNFGEIMGWKTILL